MEQQRIELVVVLDRSGSMASVVDDTIGGFNTFLEEQKRVPGAARLTLTRFDHEYEIVHECVDLATVPPLDRTTYVPRGSTALLDAIGRTISAVRGGADAGEGWKVVFAILTDGRENASREFSRPAVLESIRRQREEHGWEFVFLGANQDAIGEAGAIGIDSSRAASWNSSRAAYAIYSSKLAQFRVNRDAKSLDFDASDRSKLDEDPDDGGEHSTRGSLKVDSLKNVRVVLAFLVWMLLAASPALAADFGVGVRAGTQGLGAEFGVGFSPLFGLRAGAYAVDVSVDYEEDDIDYDGTLQLGGYGLLADVFPMKGTFRLTAGVLSNRNAVELKAVPTAPIEIGDDTYDPAEVGTLSGDVGFDDTVPYFGIGWGNVSRGKRFGFLCDLGVIRQGSGQVALSSSSGLVDPADLAAEAEEIEDDISDYELWPVVSFGLSIRLGSQR